MLWFSTFLPTFQLDLSVAESNNVFESFLMTKELPNSTCKLDSFWCRCEGDVVRNDMWHLSTLFLISHFHLQLYCNWYYCYNSFHWLVLEYIFSIPLLSFFLCHSVRHCSCKPDVTIYNCYVGNPVWESILFNRPL